MIWLSQQEPQRRRRAEHVAPRALDITSGMAGVGGTQDSVILSNPKLFRLGRHPEEQSSSVSGPRASTWYSALNRLAQHRQSLLFPEVWLFKALASTSGRVTRPRRSTVSWPDGRFIKATRAYEGKAYAKTCSHFPARSVFASVRWLFETMMTSFIVPS